MRKLGLLAIAMVFATVGSLHAELITLTKVATYQTGSFDDSAAEIVAFDTKTKLLFVVNASDDTIDVLDLPNYDAETCDLPKIKSLDDLGGSPNSVAARHGLIAVAIENDPKQEPGWVAFFDAQTCEEIKRVEVGALPDMLTFTPNGRYVLVANEGEPNDDYTVDPEGSISIIDLRGGVNNCKVKTADFSKYIGKEDDLRDAGVRIFGPGANAAQDLEPEYVTSANSRIAYVTCQENNAFAIVDIRRAKVLDIESLGFKDHSQTGNELDASNRDDAINIRDWPVFGMYQPDSIASYKRFGKTFIVSANEGDSRDYDGFSEEERVNDLTLSDELLDYDDNIQDDANLGRLKITTTLGDADDDETYEELYAYGARSFSIWTYRRGRLIQVYDSGSDFEDITATLLPDDFNSNNDENDSFDSRSDDKGPEPEAVELARIGLRTYAFIGLERVGGIMIYDVTNPYAPEFCGYETNRDFSGDAEAGTAGDLGPEGLKFIPRHKSPTRKPLLISANEVSGTTTVFEVGFDRPALNGELQDLLDELFDGLDDFLSGLPF